MSSYFRVHPNINFARVGTSKEYYLAPETAAGEVADPRTGLFGGLPVKAGTENTPITEDDFRDSSQQPRRQAARFRIFAYEAEQEQYPGEDQGREIKVGDNIDGKIVKEIIWTVHLANKKNNNYKITSANHKEEGITAYENGETPPLRNASFGEDLNDEKRLAMLIIDAGPRALSASTDGNQTLAFDTATEASYVDDKGHIQPQPDYPVSFPNQHFDMFDPLGKIDTLGEMTIESGTGRLIVTGGYGRCSAIESNGHPPPLDNPIDNDGWFDDTSDGPVKATILFEDGSSAEAVHGWVVCTDPGYAPQTRNVVSTWDDVFSTWVENLDLIPSLYSSGSYNSDYEASYNGDVLPVFHGAFLQRWNTNLPSKGVKGHDFVASIKPGDDPKAKIPHFKDLIRDPNLKDEDSKGVKMPLALGDATRSFLSLTPTQYFLMYQWYDGKSVVDAPAIGAGERLDKVVLENCLGGRYSPGIDLTFIVRDVNLYQQNWRGQTGPFRINLQPLDYSRASKKTPFLQEGYVPLRTAMVEPGDLCKFMSQPWHTDYNSCATHLPDPNEPKGNNTLYWSWPAQRPVNVHPKEQCTYDAASNTWNLGGQLYSVRGDEGHGTSTPYPQQQGRYQCYFDFVENWHKVGFVIQGCQIPAEQGGDYGKDKFLEVASLFDTAGDMVSPWPTAVEEGYKKPGDCGPPDHS
ncbi:MAG: LodA/GoxA family CTQ-dependent oxidase [Gammaproteobacteria bacterium]